jgi:hypothetical protein
MNNDKINELTKQAHDQQREQISAAINNSFNSLVANREVSKLPEEIFKSYFLPFFLGETKEAPTSDRNPLTDWISIAGTPMAEVEIISPAGEVLFAVPALYDTDMLNIVTRSPGNSIADIAHEYELRKAVLPRAAANFLNTALLNKSEAIFKSSDEKSTSERWDEIRKRYNKGSFSDGITHFSKDALNPDTDITYE